MVKINEGDHGKGREKDCVDQCLRRWAKAMQDERVANAVQEFNSRVSP